MTLQRGFTLIELMVVLVIMGMALVGISVGFDRDDQAQLNESTDALTAWLQDVVSRAVMDGGVYGVYIGPAGLSVHYNVYGRWFAVADASHWMPPAGITLKYVTSDQLGSGDAPQLVVLPSMDVLGGSTFTLAKADHQARIFWTGETAQFVFEDFAP